MISLERPLAGRTLVVTRARAQAAELEVPLRSLGATVVRFPTIRIADPVDSAPLRAALLRLDVYEWVVFTSVNGVRKVMAVADAIGVARDAFRDTRLAAIGPATARALAACELSPSLVPESYRAEALVEALCRVMDREGKSSEESAMRGLRILLLRASEARDALPDGLRAAGARVDVVSAYRTLPESADATDLRARLEGNEIDWLTFTASSTVRNYVTLMGSYVGRARVAVIGPITAETARELGLRVDLEASEYTIGGLVDALVSAESLQRSKEE